MIKTIAITINDKPRLRPLYTRFIVSRTIVITCTISRCYPNTGNKLSVFCQLVSYVFIKLIATGCCSHRGRTEIIPITVDLLPTAGKFTNFRITVYICSLIKEHTSKLGLTVVNTGCTEVIVVAVNLVYTKKLFAILIVSIAAVFYRPTFLNDICQGVVVLESHIGCTEVCTRFAGKIRIYEGIKSVNFLVFGLLCEGVKCICSEITLIAEGTGVNNAETVVFKRIVLRCELNTLHHTEGICRCGIDRLGLVDPVKRKGKSIGLFVEFCLREREILIHDIEVFVIDDQIVIKVNGRRDLGQNADTFCKLEQEVPCSRIFQICTGKHIYEIVELLGNRDLRHVDRKDVGSLHLFAGIDCRKGNAVNSGSVEDITEPCKLTVTAGCHVKVKGVFSLLEHIEGDRASYACVILPVCGDLNDLYTGSFTTNENIAVDCAVLVIFKSKYDITVTDCNGLIVVACRNGKHCIGTVNRIHMRFCEVYVFGNDNIHFRYAYDLIIELHINFNRTV